MSKLLPNATQRGELFDVKRGLTLLETRAEGSGNGTLSGVFNMIGEIDSYWTISHPRSRAFTSEGCDEFKSKGHFLGGHDSRATGIGYISDCKVDGRRFGGTCSYHSTAKAQEYRTIAKERLDAGKEVGLSIGFTVSRYQYFESGKDLLDYLRNMQEDLSMYNVQQIEAWENDVWLMWVDRVYEVSQVTFQSNEPSVADAVRSEGEMTISVRIVNGEPVFDEDLLSALSANFAQNFKAKLDREFEKSLIRGSGLVTEANQDQFEPDTNEQSVSDEDLERILVDLERLDRVR